MISLLKSTLSRFRIIAFIEGISFVLLLFLAMPMKYIFKQPEFVRIIGTAHGILFVLYLILLLQSAIEYRMQIKTIALLFVSSIIPFGTFWADKRILRQFEKN